MFKTLNAIGTWFIACEALVCIALSAMCLNEAGRIVKKVKKD